MKSLILKVLPVILAVILFQMVDVSESKAAGEAWGCGSGGTHYIVCYGDTLFSIGRQFDKDPYCLADANGLWNPNYIYAGQVIYVPGHCGRYPWWGHQPVGCWGDGCGPVWKPSHGCDRGNDCWQNDCGYDDCDWGGWGYDQTGYYYDRGGWGHDENGNGYDHYKPHYQRYSYTCGYGGNCY
jgi:LysM repeat protein